MHEAYFRKIMNNLMAEKTSILTHGLCKLVPYSKALGSNILQYEKQIRLINIRI